MPFVSLPPFPFSPPAFHAALLTWFARHQRRLPWRDAPSLYKTVVSEFMLQQTQVKTVLPYFTRWLHPFPDFNALAAAPEAAVLRQWEGLGYYSRARRLHHLARTLVALPSPPVSPADWLALPGIGPYTAAAVTSITFNTPIAAVDGNVVRILARLTANSTAFRDGTAAVKALTPFADALLNHEQPGNHNQAMMELGATVCHRQNPLCTVCPVLAFCAAQRQGLAAELPRLAPKSIERRTVPRLWLLHHDHLLLHLAAPGATRLAGLHELPSSDALHLPAATLAKLPVLMTGRRSITRFAFTEPIHGWPHHQPLPPAAPPLPPAPHSRNSTPPPPSASPNGLVWVPLPRLDSLSLSGPHRRWISSLLSPPRR